MDFSQIRVMEHLAIDCPLSLRDFCDAMQQRFELPDFEFDAENETEWGLVEHEGIEYNVSRPFEVGTLQSWDQSVPEGCNVGVSLLVSQECPPTQDVEWGSATLVPHVAEGLADLFGSTVYHHRSWLGVGENVIRTKVFYPKSKQA